MVVQSSKAFEGVKATTVVVHHFFMHITVPAMREMASIPRQCPQYISDIGY